MKTPVSIKKILCVLMSVLLLLGSLPLVFAQETPEVIASFEGTEISNKTFTTPVIISGINYDIYSEDDTPSIVFQNCTFLQGIQVVAGCNYNVFFRGSCQIENGINKMGDTVQYDIPEQIIFGDVPSGTELNLDGLYTTVQSTTPYSELTYNGVYVKGDESYLTLNNYRFDISPDYNRSMLVECIDANGVDTLSFTDASRVQSINAFFGEDCTGEIYVDITEEAPFGGISVLGYRNGDGVEEYREPVNIKGQVSQNDLYVSGLIDISALDYDHESGMIFVQTDNMQSVVSIGNNYVTLNGTGKCDVLIKAEEGAYISADRINSRSLTVQTGSTLATKTPDYYYAGEAHIFSDRDVYIPGINTDYELELYSYPETESIPYQLQYFQEEGKTHLNVSEEDCPQNLTSYYLHWKYDGVQVMSVVNLKNCFFATPEITYIEDRTFDEPITVLCAEDDYNTIVFTDCVFNARIEAKVSSQSLEIDTNYCQVNNGIYIENINPENHPNPYVSIFNLDNFTIIHGEDCDIHVQLLNPEASVNLNGVKVGYNENIGGESGIMFIDYFRCCWADHGDEYYGDHSECNPEDFVGEISVRGYVNEISMRSSTAVKKLSFNGIYNDCMVYVKDDASDCPDNRLRFQRRAVDEDMNYLADPPYTDEPQVYVVGTLANGDAEFCGKFDISDFSVSDENSIILGTWSGIADYDIGDNYVQVHGCEDTYVSIHAYGGAVVEKHNLNATVNINSSSICIANPVWYGNREQGLKVVLNSIDETLNYGLYHNDELVTCDIEVDYEAGQTILLPQTDRDDLYGSVLTAEYDGVTYCVFVVSETENCQHNDLTCICVEASCTANAHRVYFCPDCGYSFVEKVSAEDGGAPLGHNFSARVDSEGYLFEAGDCCNPSQYYISCTLCGLSSKGTEYESTFTLLENAHAWDWDYPENTSASTCINPGVTTYHCQNCTATTQEFDLPDPTNHEGTPTIIANYVPSTCQKAGYSGDLVYSCCGVVYTYGQDLPLAAHEDSNSDGFCDTCGTALTYVTSSKILVGTQKAKAGDEVEIPVTMEENEGFMYLKLKIDYNANALELISIENGTVAEDGFAVSDKGNSVQWDLSGDTVNNGLLCTLHFKVRENTPDGELVVLTKTAGSYNYNEQEVPFTDSMGKIQVISFIYGDCNGDGVIDGKDIIRLRKYLVDCDSPVLPEDCKVTEGADCNGDGIIDGRDLIRLRKYLVNLDEETGISTVELGK